MNAIPVPARILRVHALIGGVVSPVAPRIRTIKPEFWGSPDVSRLSRDARLLVVGLISMADDDGRFLASPNAIIGHVYPNDENVTPVQVRKWLAEVSARDEPVHLYEVDGVRYGVLPNWHKHQRINRYSASKMPAPLIECAPRTATRGSDD